MSIYGCSTGRVGRKPTDHVTALAYTLPQRERDEDAPFRTKAMREVDELEAKPVYGLVIVADHIKVF